MNALGFAYNGLVELNFSSFALIMGVAFALVILFGKNKIKKLLFLMILIGLIGTGLHFRREIGRQLFPMPFRGAILENAELHRIDPALVAAVIFVESGFDPGAVSHRGAVGLMQVMPETGQWVGEQVGRNDITRESLKSHRINIFVGTWYLRYLLDQLDQDQVVTLAAYNAGWNRVQDWRQQKVWSGRLEELHRIPFPETRKYVARVLRFYRIYSYLYPN